MMEPRMTAASRGHPSVAEFTLSGAKGSLRMTRAWSDPSFAALGTGSDPRPFAPQAHPRPSAFLLLPSSGSRPAARCQRPGVVVRRSAPRYTRRDRHTVPPPSPPMRLAVLLLATALVP